MRAGNVRSGLRLHAWSADDRIHLPRIGVDAVRRRTKTAGHQAVYSFRAKNLIGRIRSRSRTKRGTSGPPAQRPGQ